MTDQLEGQVMKSFCLSPEFFLGAILSLYSTRDKTLLPVILGTLSSHILQIKPVVKQKFKWCLEVIHNFKHFYMTQFIKIIKKALPILLSNMSRYVEYLGILKGLMLT